MSNKQHCGSGEEGEEEEEEEEEVRKSNRNIPS